MIQSPYRDAQQETPTSYCSRCWGEIYGEDRCYVIGGEVICLDCLDSFEKEAESVMAGHELAAYLNHLYGGTDDIE